MRGKVIFYTYVRFRRIGTVSMYSYIHLNCVDFRLGVLFSIQHLELSVTMTSRIAMIKALQNKSQIEITTLPAYLEHYVQNEMFVETNLHRHENRPRIF